jgi:hypothetical protein
VETTEFECVSEPDLGSGRERWPRIRRHRLALALAYVAYLGGLLWLTDRLFWACRFGTPLVRSTGEARVWDTYYPELRATGALDAQVTRNDDRVDVLLLGASVLQQVSIELERDLHQRYGDRVRLFNLARPAHTSRDSFLKYTKLKDKPFDVVIVYDCINDARLNCCFARDFRDDYTHCDWYFSIQRRLDEGTVILSDFVRERFGNFISLKTVDQRLLDEGREIKTKGPFRRNIESIVRGAERSGQTVVLMGFAYHIPANYSKEAFLGKKLDYTFMPYSLPAEIWGRPANVAAAIDAHNEIIRDLARSYANVVAVDQNALLPKNATYFVDPCHLTGTGCRAFVANLMSALAPRLDRMVAEASRTN